ncbi:MAG: hypothetical protein ACFFFK_05970 [Candidatus Thorarchaeota archaeon]
MNEYAVLMKLLTRSGNPIGAGVDDMLDALGLPEDMGRDILFKRLGELQSRLEPVGLTIKHNPVSSVFYVDTSLQSKMSQTETTLPDRLAATLLIIITLAYQEGGWVSFDRVREFRKKSLRGVMVDLRELQNQGYVEIDSASKRVRLGLRVPFEIDYEIFFRDLVAER